MGTVFDENVSVCNHPWAAPPCDENKEETEEVVEVEETDDNEPEYGDNEESGVVEIDGTEEEESVMRCLFLTASEPQGPIGC